MVTSGIAAPGEGRTRSAESGWRRLAGLVTLCLLVTGCTAGFVYDRLDWVVSWYVNGLVSLDEPQERQLRDIVRRTLTWHRDTQVPRYVDLLERLDRETDAPVTPEYLESRYQEMVGFLDDFTRHVVPEAAPLLRTLDAGQIAELGENLAEDNEEMWEEFAGADPDRRRKRRERSAVRAIQRFTGTLSGAQKALVAERIAGMADVSEQWMERRRNWQESFLGLLRNPPPGAGFETALRDLALEPDRFDTREYRGKVEANRAVVMTMMAEITNGLSDRQRDHLGRKFTEYAADLRRIGAAH
jgi:hypothetical protein